MRTMAALLALAVVLMACDGGSTPSPPPTSGPPVDSVEAFQDFSGLTIPATAEQVTVRVVGTSAGRPEYRVGFALPTAELDAFCTSGEMQRPLRVRTIPASVRERFAFTGDAATGVAVAEASLPSDVSIQRQVLAVGTKTPTSQVLVAAYKLPS